MSSFRHVIAAAAAAAFAIPSSAAALAPCPGTTAKANELLADQGLLESVIVDRQGRLFFTGPQGLMRLDSRDAEPKLLVPVESGGGLAFDFDGMLIVGQGNSIANGSTGDNTGPSQLLKVNPDTGDSVVYATGLSMGNGVVRAPDGAFYASNDIGHNIDKIVGGKTERGWAQVESGNGLAVSLDGKYLFANQTFRPAAIARVEIANPANVTTFAAPTDPADLAAGLDGMVRDADGTLFAAANGSGAVWQANPDGSLCLVTGGLAPFPDGPSAVAIGARRGTFGAKNLYVVTFGGQLLEIEGVVTPPAVMRLRSSKKTLTQCGRHSGVTLTATTPSGSPVAGARVAVGGLVSRTGPKGRARIRGPFPGNGPFRAGATREGYDPASKAITVLGCR